MNVRLLIALQTLAEALAGPNSDWATIEQAWLDASIEAAGTEVERPLRDTGLALQLRDVEQLNGSLGAILSWLEK